MSQHRSDVTVHVRETVVLTDDGPATQVITEGESGTSVLVEEETFEVTGELTPPPEVTAETVATEVVSVGSQTIVREGGDILPQQQRVFVQQDEPQVDHEFAWFEIREDGDFSLWFKEAE